VNYNNFVNEIKRFKISIHATLYNKTWRLYKKIIVQNLHKSFPLKRFSVPPSSLEFTHLVTYFSSSWLETRGRLEQWRNNFAHLCECFLETKNVLCHLTNSETDCNNFDFGVLVVYVLNR
jgi:hypothetical protein